MEPGRELDAVVSGLIGLDPSDWPWECYVEKHSTDEGVWCYCCVMNVREGDRVPPPYSTDIAAAWEMVVEKMRAKGYEWSLETDGEEWYAGLFGPRGPELELLASATASTAPHAICLAALKAVGQTP